MAATNALLADRQTMSATPTTAFLQTRSKDFPGPNLEMIKATRTCCSSSKVTSPSEETHAPKRGDTGAR